VEKSQGRRERPGWREKQIVRCCWCLLVLRHGSTDGIHKAAATKLCTCMVNIRAITSHFQAKFDEMHASQLTEQEILDVVKSHYDSLTLKLQENLDGYERYDEQPHESNFFVQMVKLVAAETRLKLQRTQLDHQSVLNELSTIK